MTKALYNLGKYLAKYKWLTTAIWAALIAGAIFWASNSSGILINNNDMPGTESQAAQDVLNSNFPQAAGTSSTIIFQAKTGNILEPQKQQYISKVLQGVANMDTIAAVSNPYQQVNGAMPNISQDKTTAMATANFNAKLDVMPTDTTNLTRTIDRYKNEGQAAGAKAIAGGNAYFATANSESSDNTSEMLGLAAAVIILLIAFGSIIAMGLPLLNALLGLGVSISSIYILSQWLDFSSIGPTVASMLGLGVGIDYALFVVNRFRENQYEGYDRNESIGRAIATAGQAVIVAGLTVIIALLGLLIIGIPIISSIAYAAAIAVAVAILISITLIPALLSLTASWIEKINLHHAFKRTGFKHSLAKSWGEAVTKRPLTIGAIALIAMIVLILPISSLTLGPPGQDTIPSDNPQRTVYDIVTDKFGVGYNGSLLIVERLPKNVSEQQVQTGLQNITKQLQATNNIVAVTSPKFNADKTIAIQAVIPGSSPSSSKTVELVHKIKKDVLPKATKNSGISTKVGGFTAIFVDMSEKIASQMPLFIGTVILLAFLLLVVVFRSLLVSLIAALMIMLSASATFGVLVAIFQWGWLGGLINLETTGPLVSYVPILVFAILFGLTMDYEIFLVSRIREAYLSKQENNPAITKGLQNSTRIIIAAALIMFCVFVSFNSQENVVVKMFGTGLAAAVIIDVLLARMVLVPALMSVGHKATWWLPSWLQWIPDLKFEDESVLDSPLKKKP